MNWTSNYRTIARDTLLALLTAICANGCFATDVPVIDATALSTPANVGVSYSVAVKAKGQKIKFTAVGLPKGLKLNAKSGLVKGKPVIGGVFWITLFAKNTAGTSAAFVQMTVNGGRGAPVLPVLPTSLALSVAADLRLSITGQTPLTLAVTGLPPGIQLINNTELMGTPTTGGEFIVNFVASNAAGTTTKRVMLSVSGETGAPVFPIFGAQSLDASFDLLLTATGKTPIAFAAADLPPGVSLLGGRELKVSGSLGVGGVYWSTITAKNSVGTTTAFVLFIVGGGQTVPVLTAVPANQTGTVGLQYNQFLTATGKTPMTFSAAGLPPGLTLVDGARIAGVPAAEGTFIVSISAMNDTGTSDSVTYTLLIGPANGAPLIARPGGSDPSITLHFGEKASFTIQSAGTGPLTYSFGALPLGLTASGANLKGTLYATEGTYTIPLTVFNTTGSDTVNLTLVALAVPLSGLMAFDDTYSTQIVNDPDFGPDTIGVSSIDATMTINLNGNTIAFDPTTMFEITIGNYHEQFVLGDAQSSASKYTFPYTFTNDAGKDIPLGAVTLTLNPSAPNPTLTIAVSMNESDAMDLTQNFYADNYLADDPPVPISFADTVVVNLGAKSFNFNITGSGLAPVHRIVNAGSGANATQLELISASTKGGGPLVP